MNTVAFAFEAREKTREVLYIRVPDFGNAVTLNRCPQIFIKKLGTIVFVIVALLTGNLIFNVVIVFAMSSTLSTLKFMPLVFSILSSSLYIL
ncbi:MAG: hypothetical protein LBH04_01875 [Tannerellaceae bacterium]|jgi:hypothetical protein|nr:hypothetical protein [Tannerellaceae bacterium]